MIAADGTPKILDFGLVKSGPSLTDTNSPTELHLSRDGMVMGTANYMSPEQARGEDVDFRSDQFAFGLILYEMIAGRHPFARSSQVETMAAIIKDDPAPLPAGVPQPLAWIVERCLSRERGDRYGSTSDLAHDLRRAAAAAPSSPTSAVRRGRARWWWLALLPLLFAPLLFWPRRHTAVAEPIHADVAVAELSHVLINETSVPVMVSPDGRHLLIEGSAHDGRDGIWIRDLRDGTTRLLVAKGMMPAWSSDGKGIVFYADGKLKTMPVAGGPASVICDARAEGVPAWHGDAIVFGQYSAQDRGLYRVSARGGTPELIIAAQLADRSFSPPWWPQFVDEGRSLLYLRFAFEPGRGSINHAVFLATADGKEEKIVARISSRPHAVADHLLYVRDGSLLAQRFDARSGRLDGDARPLLDGLHYFRSTGSAAFSTSNNGLLVWRSARNPSRLVWLDRNGMEQGEVSRGLVLGDGRLSPDGKRYAAGVIDPKLGIADVWVFDLERQSPERRTFGMLDEKAPVWTADGRILLYRADGGSGPPDIFRLRPGESRGELLHQGWGVEEPHDISADGKWLLFVDYFSTGTDINVLPLDPRGDPRPFISTPFNETSPRFSPDGRWVAYTSDVSGTSEVYVRSFEDPPVTGRVSKDGGSHPRWNRNGSELFFLGPDGRVMSAAVTGGGLPAAPRMLFQSVDITDFDPSPDGSKFLVQLEEGSRDASIHLLINWETLLADPSAAR